MADLVIPIVIFGVLCFVFGYLVGEGVGTRDTELRWSDAVKRAAFNRNCTCANSHYDPRLENLRGTKNGSA